MQHTLSAATAFQRKLLALGCEGIQPVKAKKTATPYAGVEALHGPIPTNCHASLGFAIRVSACIPSFAGVAGL